MSSAKKRLAAKLVQAEAGNLKFALQPRSGDLCFVLGKNWVDTPEFSTDSPEFFKMR